MSEVERHSCFDCEYYTTSIGEKGYCKLFRHETTLPDTACTRYEKKEAPKYDTGDYSFIPEHTESESMKVINILMVSAFFACTVLTIIGFILGFYFNISVVSTEEIPVVLKILSVLLTVAAVLFGAYVLFSLGKKYVGARIAELFLAVFIVMFVLLNYEDIWSDFSTFTLQAVKFLFGSFM